MLYLLDEEKTIPELSVIICNLHCMVRWQSLKLTSNFTKLAIAI